MPSKILAIPFLLIVGALGYYSWKINDAYVFYILPFFLVLAMIYIFAPQIDWWWYERYPPDVDKPIRKMLEKTNPFYNRLTPTDQTKFRQKLAMFVMGVNFMPKGWETIPEDVKFAIAANAVQLNFHQEDLLFEKYENVVVYPTAFPSPQYPEHFHSSEVFKEDGVLLFSAQEVMYGSLKPQQYYNVAIHEYIKVFMDKFQTPSLPVFTEEDWSDLGKVSHLKEVHIRQILNVPDIDPSIVAATLYHSFPESFQKIFPEQAVKLDNIFGSKRVAVAT